MACGESVSGPVPGTKIIKNHIELYNDTTVVLIRTYDNLDRFQTTAVCKEEEIDLCAEKLTMYFNISAYSKEDQDNYYNGQLSRIKFRIIETKEI